MGVVHVGVKPIPLLTLSFSLFLLYPLPLLSLVTLPREPYTLRPPSLQHHLSLPETLFLSFDLSPLVAKQKEAN